MKLEHKAGLSVLAALAVMTGVVSVILSQVVRRSYGELELQQAQLQIDGVKRAIDQELEGLARTAADYGDWIDTSNFLIGRHATYMDDNYNADSMRNVRVDHALLFNNQGQMRDGRSPQGGVSETTAVTRAMAELVRPLVGELVTAGRQARAKSTVLGGPTGLLLVAVHPVIPAEVDAPFPGGVLVFARNFDEAVVGRVAALQGVPVRVEREHSDELAQREAVHSRALAGDRVSVSAGADWLLGHFPLSDGRGNVVGWVHVEMNRLIYRQGVHMSWLLVGVVAGTGMVFSILIVWLLRQLVTRRLQRTCDQLAVIEAEARPEARLMPEGEDELARLANQINAMLESIENAQEERDKRDRQQRSLERQLQQAQKLEVVGTFAGGIAHDFNNYLAAVKGWVNLAQMAAREGELRADYLDQAERAIVQGSLLTKQLLLFSRREPAHLAEIFVGNLLRESTDLIRMALPKTVHVEVEIASDARVRIDPSQLQQVWLNLAVNASDAMAGEGVLKLIVRAQRLPSATVPGTRALTPGLYVWLQVTDTGTGVPSHILPRIFEPFFTTKTAEKGTGLGLAVVQRIVHGSGGAIEVQTAVGQGTTFHLYLPALVEKAAPDANAPGATGAAGESGSAGEGKGAGGGERAGPSASVVVGVSAGPVEPAPAAAPVARPSSDLPEPSAVVAEPSMAVKSYAGRPAPAGTLGRVLLVDDDQMVCAVWREALLLAGYTVTTRADGEGAWQLLQTQALEFDVLVADHVMPRMDGLELASRVMVAFPHLPVVLLTAVLPMAAGDLATRGFFGVLTKPVGMGEMIDTVSRAVARRSAIRN